MRCISERLAGKGRDGDVAFVQHVGCRKHLTSGQYNKLQPNKAMSPDKIQSTIFTRPPVEFVQTLMCDYLCMSMTTFWLISEELLGAHGSFFHRWCVLRSH